MTTDKLSVIEEGNILISEFDGWFTDPNVNEGSEINYFHTEKSTRLTKTLYIPSSPQSFKYHSSWDWLMPAWKKFYDEVVLDQDKYVTPEYCKDLECMEYALSSANLLGAFKHFVNLIKWYNQNK